MTPADPDFAQTIARSFAAQGLMTTLGAKLERVEPGHVAIRLAFDARVGQQQGLFHGGAIGAIADSAGGYAALSLMPAGSEVVTVEYKINFIRPASATDLIAEGHVLRAGRSVTVGRVDVYAANDRTLVAVVQATFMRVAATAR